MRVALVGSDYEENLGIGMVAASLVGARHRVDVVPFNHVDELDSVVERIAARRPALVGLAMQFQHRAWEFLLLSRKLRAIGFRGHITCGGHWPTLAAAEILSHESSVDSVVLHEGEETIVELVAALAERANVHRVPGLAVRGPGGRPQRTAPRRLRDDLDRLPFAHRYRASTRQLGIPFIPMYGSRGCWGSCAYCSITTFYRDAKAYGGARKVRLRSPGNIAAEMAALWHRHGGPSIFCFHDDTFLMPRPKDTVARLRAVRQALDEFGVGKVGLIGKARPDCVTADLARELRRLGVMRIFLGVENVSQPGQDHLNRRTRTEDIERAVTAIDKAGIFVCYNLLLFEPDAQLEHVRENLAFMRAHAHIPVNFCRAEPYHGTPIQLRMANRGALGGCFLGWDYRVRDDRTELLFRITTTAFHGRNFDPSGVANRYIGLAYLAQVLRSFYDCSSARAQLLLDRCRRLTTDITHDTVDLLEEALRLAQASDLDDHDRIERETALLGLRIAAHDRVLHARIDELVSEIEEFASEQPRKRTGPQMSRQLREVLQRLTIAGAVAATTSGCGETSDSSGTSSAANAGSSGEDGSSGTTATGARSSSGGAPSYGGYQGSGGDAAPGGTPGYGGWLSDGGAPSYGGYPGTGGEGPPGGTPGYGGMVGDPVLGGYPGYGGYPGSGGDGAPGGTPGYGGWLSDGGAPSYGGYLGSGGDAAPGGTPGYGGYPGTGGGEEGTGGVYGYGGWVGDGGMGATDFSGGHAGIAGYDGGAGGDSGSGTSGQAGTEGGAAGAPVAGGLRGEDPPPAPGGMSLPPDPSAECCAVVEHWANTAPRRALRSQDLPLWDSPMVRLRAEAEGDTVRVRVCGEEQNLSLRWETNGEVSGEGREVTWCPASRDDQLTLAVRGRGGVAVTALRARDVSGG